MSLCNCCPRNCNINRKDRFHESGEFGFCQMPRSPVVAHIDLHQWEEPCISGSRGSGTVFFSGCTMQCVFCQNYEISRNGYGKEISIAKLRALFEQLIARGAHNINLVNPTHFVDAIAEALNTPLSVPVIYNSSGYESIASLKRLEGKIQIYLPDMKYKDSHMAKEYSHTKDYFKVASLAIQEMYRQVGPFSLDNHGLMTKGVLIRHLIIPNHIANTLDVIDWVRETFEKDSVLFSLMSQYIPCGNAKNYNEINRSITLDEYVMVEDYLFESGIESGFLQELDSASEVYIPKFDCENF